VIGLYGRVGTPELLRGRNFLALIGELPAHRRGRLPQSARTRRMSLSVRHLEKRLRLF
jgi:hypothetical protein